MRLVNDNCIQCGACTSICPIQANKNCVHCSDPACVKACPENAFFEVNGVWSVDPEKCTGCGKCAEACEHNAIYVDGFARKCDLCLGEPQCIKVCPKGLKLVNSDEDEETIKDLLGWEKTSGEYTTNILSFSYEEAVLFKEISEHIINNKIELEKFNLNGYCEKNGLKLNKTQEKKILDLIKKENRGYSILEMFLENDELEEVVVNGLGPIRVFKRNKGWEQTDLQFTQEKKIIEIINKIARGVGRRVTLKTPRVNATLEDGSRLHAAIPPIVKSPCMTIRKFRANPFSPVELILNKTISAEPLAFLWMAMQCDLNVLVAGSTGSGKTTTLNVLTSFIPLDERIIVVEETPEINIPHKHLVKLSVNEGLGIGMNELITDTLRMRPDRIVIGEVREEKEAKALMNTMLAGQGKGSISTFHGTSSEETLKRLKGLGIEENDLSSIDLIVVQKRWTKFKGKTKKEVRRVTEISEVNEGKPVKLFDYDYSKDSLRTKNTGKLREKIMHCFDFDEKEFVRELWSRKKFLRENRSDFFGFVGEANKFLYEK